ncbi:cytochrome P450 736A117-like [Rhodamnia argentea]|uniref:Cytochrome P450 736A117-like n=1 Tax=Rhodamnia argentea TaxID=178133 RepID=A0ABM3HIZ5_9MYRT|nr:cytochrome P450 736A117-like [Rhodamnia argentea]
MAMVEINSEGGGNWRLLISGDRGAVAIVAIGGSGHKRRRSVMVETGGNWSIIALSMLSFNVSPLLSFPPSLTSIILVLFITFLTLKCLRLLCSSTAAADLHLPPSPPKFPIIGNLHQLGNYPHRSLQALSRRYGPLMMLHFGSTPVLVVSSADCARDIMKTHDVIFSDRTRSTLSERLLYHRKDVSLAPYGEYWRQMRSISVLQLLSNKRVQSFRTVREEEISLLMDKIERQRSVDLSGVLASLTNDVICRVALGRKYSEGNQSEKFKGLLADLVGLLGIFNVGDFIPSLGWINKLTGLDAKADLVAREFDQFLDKVVEEHRRKMEKKSTGGGGGEDRRDFVDVLLEIEKDKTVGFALGADSIKALILDMFAGGTDTTHTVLEWAMTELLRHPRAMNILQTEVREIANGKPMISDEDLEKLHYLRAVVKETLRLYPPIPLLIPRLSTQDVKIQGYDIAAGTMVITNAWTIGRDPSTWDEPDEFKPERFLNSSVDFKGQDFELIPFGAGRRGCPGIAFAMATNDLVLANLVNKFDWALPEGMTAEDLDMTECTGLTIHRKVHLLAVATPFPS